jgi:hypothetical protein
VCASGGLNRAAERRNLLFDVRFFSFLTHSAQLHKQDYPRGICLQCQRVEGGVKI